MLPILGGNRSATRIDEIGECVRQAELGRPFAALRGRAEQPDVRMIATTGQRRQTSETMVWWHPVPHVRQQLGELLPEIIGRRMAPVPLECKRGERIATRSPPDGKIDTIRVERAQHAEGLSDFERTVMRQ